VHSFAQSAAVAAYSERHEVGANGQEFDQGDIQTCPQVKKQLWGGEFWSAKYFVSMVGRYGDEAMIGQDVKNQIGNSRSCIQTIN